MRADVLDALESAQSAASPGGQKPKQRSFRHVRGLVLAVVRELPDDMTVNELREELESGTARQIADEEDE